MEPRSLCLTVFCFSFCVLQCFALPTLVKRDVGSFLAEQMAKAKHDDPPAASMSAADTEDAARDKIRQQALVALQHKDTEKAEQSHQVSEVHQETPSHPLDEHHKEEQHAGSEDHHAQAVPVTTSSSPAAVPATPVSVVKNVESQDSAAQPSHVEQVPHLHGELASLKNSDIIEDVPPAHANATKAA